MKVAFRRFSALGCEAAFRVLVVIRFSPDVTGRSVNAWYIVLFFCSPVSHQYHTSYAGKGPRNQSIFNVLYTSNTSAALHVLYIPLSMYEVRMYHAVHKVHAQRDAYIIFREDPQLTAVLCQRSYYLCGRATHLSRARGSFQYVEYSAPYLLRLHAAVRGHPGYIKITPWTIGNTISLISISSFLLLLTVYCGP